MAITFSEATLALLDGRNYAVLATLNGDGSPQTSAMWVGRDGTDLVFSTVEGRLKHRNIARDPRVSVTVHDALDPENYVELRGRASIEPDTELRVGHLLARKYDGREHAAPGPGEVRVVLRVAVDKVTGYAA
ncbi:MAG TPA: PPOX class F420-dependent oxidoreductase [Pseudonocardiaceae bacterium]|jgi:PPOX class probable F420-dependent enzyme|nr:PPOX class F420-dependent oxidoreductase [Pseudonocardiaceae bacterium]